MRKYLIGYFVVLLAAVLVTTIALHPLAPSPLLKEKAQDPDPLAPSPLL